VACEGSVGSQAKDLWREGSWLLQYLTLSMASMQSLLRINGVPLIHSDFSPKKRAKNGTILLEPEAMPPHCVCAAALLEMCLRRRIIGTVYAPPHY
jgi:hypothetical protein